MRQVLLSIGVTKHHWLQHNLPWLAVLAMLFGFERDEGEPAEEPVQFDG